MKKIIIFALLTLLISLKSIAMQTIPFTAFDENDKHAAAVLCSLNKTTKNKSQSTEHAATELKEQLKDIEIDSDEEGW